MHDCEEKGCFKKRINPPGPPISTTELHDISNIFYRSDIYQVSNIFFYKHVVKSGGGCIMYTKKKKKNEIQTHPTVSQAMIA